MKICLKFNFDSHSSVTDSLNINFNLFLIIIRRDLHEKDSIEGTRTQTEKNKYIKDENK
jgi:hypothetical protein